jgi:hypothetical protein
LAYKEGRKYVLKSRVAGKYIFKLNAAGKEYLEALLKAPGPKSG